METDSAVEMRNICKAFPGVVALDSVSFSATRGEVHCLVGENGAGKSTLMKVLFGVYQPDSGDIFIDGRKVKIRDPHAASELGISIVHQERKLVPSLTALENIALGRLPRMPGLRSLVDWKAARRNAASLFQRLGVDIAPDAIVGELSASHQQLVEIAKAISCGAKVMVLDEASASLTAGEIENLFKIIRNLKEEGVTFIYISHRLEEIFEIGDRATVLRDGRLVGVVDVKEVDRRTIVKMMVGRELGKQFPARTKAAGDEVLRVEGLRAGKMVKDASFSLHEGEILGLAGLVGSGRSETACLIAGAGRPERGSIVLRGKKVRFNRPADAIRHGIGFLTEDRKGNGLILPHSVSDNLTLACIRQFARFGVIRRKPVGQLVDRLIKRLSIKVTNPSVEVQLLSGGNQQKVVLGKWLATQSKILILDEPTKGIDVGAKEEFYKIINDLASQGAAILLISSELPEVLGMSDRILVMYEGKVVGELSRDQATEEEVMAYATGGK